MSMSTMDVTRLMWSDRRKEALRLGFITTAKKARLDALCEQVAYIIDAKATHLTIVLDDVQVYAGEFNLDALPDGVPAVPFLENPEPPQLLCLDLDYSICKFVVRGSEPVLENDLPHSERFADHPIVSQFGLKAYLGVPINAPDGVDVGALCALDPTDVREWTVDDIKTMQRYAALANAVLHSP